MRLVRRSVVFRLSRWALIPKNQPTNAISQAIISSGLTSAKRARPNDAAVCLPARSCTGLKTPKYATRTAAIPGISRSKAFETASTTRKRSWYFSSRARFSSSVATGFRPSIRRMRRQRGKTVFCANKPPARGVDVSVSFASESQSGAKNVKCLIRVCLDKARSKQRVAVGRRFGLSIRARLKTRKDGTRWRRRRLLSR
jgi:hypothetical protein